MGTVSTLALGVQDNANLYKLRQRQFFICIVYWHNSHQFLLFLFLMCINFNILIDALANGVTDPPCNPYPKGSSHKFHCAQTYKNCALVHLL